MKYKWIAECSDGAFNDESALFDTEKDCYENMRNVMLEMIKCNTDYYGELGDVPEDEYMGYGIKFTRKEITYTSHNGLCIYRIVEVKEKKSYHVWQSFQGSICVDVMAEDEEEAYRIGSTILQDMTDADVINNAIWDEVQVDLN